VRGISAGLASRGHEVCIFAFGTAESTLQVNGCMVKWLPTRARRLRGRYVIPFALRDLRRELSRFDVIHAHQPFASSTLVAATVRRPSVVSGYLHAPAYLDGLSPSRRAQRLRCVLSRFDSVCCVSQAEAALVERLAGADHRVFVARPGPSAFAQTTRRTVNSRDLIAVVGGLSHHKRPDLAIRAASQAGVGHRLRIVGNGPMRSELGELCEGHGLSADDTLLGTVDDDHLGDVLARSQLTLALSTEESFGIALLDGICAGAVPLASDIPSHREIIECTGWSERCLVPLSADPLAIASRIQELMASPPMRASGMHTPSWGAAVSAVEDEYVRLAGVRA
jgi:glycosyltransferase involved in cell wall biosynthesis